MNVSDLLIQQYLTERKSIQFAEKSNTEASSVKKAQISKQRFALGPPLEDHYLTHREAQCMLLFIRGKTVDKVAKCLALSPRTVEYYLNNMKVKLKCRTKSELIGRIMETRFLEKVMPALQLDSSGEC